MSKYPIEDTLWARTLGHEPWPSDDPSQEPPPPIRKQIAKLFGDLHYSFVEYQQELKVKNNNQSADRPKINYAGRADELKTLLQTLFHQQDAFFATSNNYTTLRTILDNASNPENNNFHSVRHKTDLKDAKERLEKLNAQYRSEHYPNVSLKSDIDEFFDKNEISLHAYIYELEKNSGNRDRVSELNQALEYLRRIDRPDENVFSRQSATRLLAMLAASFTPYSGYTSKEYSKRMQEVYRDAKDLMEVIFPPQLQNKR